MSAPQVGAGDRLSLTVFVSAVVHALIVLGIGFAGGIEAESSPPPMIEITLATNPQKSTPEDYDFLAQASQDGGGTSDEAGMPERRPEAVTPGVPEGRQPVTSAPPPEQREASRMQAVVAGEGDPVNTPAEASPSERTESAPTAEARIRDEAAVAADSEPVDPMERLDARYPSKRRISARTKQHDAAAYMRRWIERVERVGNLNYPSEARTHQLSGRLIMEVTLRPDGSIHATKVLRGSRHPVLDQAATRIVSMAAPYPEVPPDVLRDDDLLVITRTWEFRDNERLRAR